MVGGGRNKKVAVWWADLDQSKKIENGVVEFLDKNYEDHRRSHYFTLRFYNRRGGGDPLDKGHPVYVHVTWCTTTSLIWLKF